MVEMAIVDDAAVDPYPWLRRFRLRLLSVERSQQGRASRRAPGVNFRLPWRTSLRTAGPTTTPGDPVAVDSYGYLCDGHIRCSCTGAGCTATATWSATAFSSGFVVGDDDGCRCADCPVGQACAISSGTPARKRRNSLMPPPGWAIRRAPAAPCRPSPSAFRTSTSVLLPRRAAGLRQHHHALDARARSRAKI